MPMSLARTIAVAADGGSLIALPSLHVFQVDAVQEHRQLGRPQQQTMLPDRGPLAIGGGQAEGSFFESLVPDRQTVLSQ